MKLKGIISLSLAVLMVLLTVLATAGCGEETTADQTTSTNTESVAQGQNDDESSNKSPSSKNNSKKPSSKKPTASKENKVDYSDFSKHDIIMYALDPNIYQFSLKDSGDNSRIAALMKKAAPIKLPF